MIRKYWVELVCLILLIVIGVLIFRHCTGKATGSASGSALVATEPAAATDWTLIIQVASGVLVALIGVSPALIRAFKSGKADEIADEIEKDIKIIVKPAEPLFTPEQLAQIKKLINAGKPIGDAVDEVKAKQ